MAECNVTKDEIRFSELEKIIFSQMLNIGCDILKRILEKQDERILMIRDKKKYKNKGKCVNTIKTLMGEVRYERHRYITNKEDGTQEDVYLLERELEMDTVGKVSQNLVDLILDIVAEVGSHRKAEKVLRELTGTSLSFEGIRNIVLKMNEKMEGKEKDLSNQIFGEDKII